MVLEVISQLCFHPFDVVRFKLCSLKFQFYLKKCTLVQFCKIPSQNKSVTY